ncbi:hypothetical protein [Cupriavidus numazuensis]|uniref:Uncharacterized protein n=1 Tax=Cupriavidus numazuensis TaxID=221992 RepID=A0ABN7PRA6_9BURK|nr:hypothetical protein [Cupriavidus numazuensis]CAG2132193.1 hypothetical protein LMG26411_00573 [Cupriavidus numazuensis]
MTAKKRKMQTAWSNGEIRTLRREWKNDKPVKDWAHKIPNRTVLAIKARANELGLGPRKVSLAGRSIAWSLMKQLLADGKPRSTLQMSREINVSRRSLDHCTRQMHGKSLRVGDWGPQGLDGVRPRLWALGKGKDKPRPPKQDRAERHHMLWLRLKKDPERLGLHYARCKNRNAERAGRLIRRDPAAAWIGTPPNHTTP